MPILLIIIINHNKFLYHQISIKLTIAYQITLIYREEYELNTLNMTTFIKIMGNCFCLDVDMNEDIKRCIQHEIELKLQQISLNTKLIKAAQSHNLEKVKALVAKGANINYISSNGEYQGNSCTALYKAFRGTIKSESNFIKVIQFLIQNGADCKFQAYTKNSYGQRCQDPIFSVLPQVLTSLKCQIWKIKLMKILIKNKININREEIEQVITFQGKITKSKSLLIYLLESCGIVNKIDELIKLTETVTLSKIKQIRENYWIKEYKKINPSYKNIKTKQSLKVNESNEISQPEYSLQFIFKILKLGVNPDGQCKEFSNLIPHRQEQFDFPLFLQRQLQNSQIQGKIIETALHRCIMNNLPDLVKLLIEKGADVKKKCIITVKKLVYPVDWPYQFIELTIKRNNYKLQKLQKQKQKHQQHLLWAENERQRYEIQKIVDRYQFQIFKTARCTYENEYPIEIYEIKQIGCLELAKLFKVDQKIINILNDALKR